MKLCLTKLHNQLTHVLKTIIMCNKKLICTTVHNYTEVSVEPKIIVLVLFHHNKIGNETKGSSQEQKKHTKLLYSIIDKQHIVMFGLP